MTGAGFGGACVALVENVDRLDHLKHRLASFFPGAKVIVPEQKAYS
jgi:galactokinase